MPIIQTILGIKLFINPALLSGIGKLLGRIDIIAQLFIEDCPDFTGRERSD